MRSLTTVPYFFRGAIVALLAIVAIGLLFGPAGLRPEPQSAEAAFLSEVKKLLASDAQADDWFGWSVAVSGTSAVVGAYLEDAGGSEAGAAYVFQRDQGGTDNWGEVTKLTASDGDLYIRFGWSVAVSGDTAIVGASFDDTGGNDAGAAYVFQRDQGGTADWFRQARTVLDEQHAQPLRAITDFNEAEMWLRRAGESDMAQAKPLLEAALEQFRALGMTGWVKLAERAAESDA